MKNWHIFFVIVLFLGSVGCANVGKVTVTYNCTRLTIKGTQEKMSNMYILTTDKNNEHIRDYFYGMKVYVEGKPTKTAPDISARVVGQSEMRYLLKVIEKMGFYKMPYPPASLDKNKTYIIVNDSEKKTIVSFEELKGNEKIRFVNIEQEILRLSRSPISLDSEGKWQKE